MDDVVAAGASLRSLSLDRPALMSTTPTRRLQRLASRSRNFVRASALLSRFFSLAHWAVLFRGRCSTRGRGGSRSSPATDPASARSRPRSIFCHRPISRGSDRSRHRSVIRHGQVLRECRHGQEERQGEAKREGAQGAGRDGREGRRTAATYVPRERPRAYARLSFHIAITYDLL